MVISAAGRIVWLLDGYTVSDRFPYSAPTGGLGNYLRNAVKVTVDAYDGTVRFYVADPADPLIRTTARIFPGLLQPLDAMPADLRAHIRYPEGLFRVQAGMYAVYHMRDTHARAKNCAAWVSCCSDCGRRASARVGRPGWAASQDEKERG